MRAILAHGTNFNWSKILSDVSDVSDADPIATIERKLRDELDDALDDTLEALLINGRMLALFIQRRHDRLAGLKVTPASIFEFAEETEFFEPESALEYWKKLLGLSDEQIAAFRRNLNSALKNTITTTQLVKSRVTDAMVKKLIDLQQETIAEGTPLSEFIKRAKDLMPDATRSMLEAEYRTRLTQAYGGARHELILSRTRTFPFTQFFAIIDGRTTWYICLSMGTAGPNGRGYIAASDDPLWIKWRPPNHFGGCRSDLSPISYLEARRMGILDAAGNKIARVGDNPNRPFGDPPRFATERGTGTIRRVEPQEGFGA